MQFIVSGQRIAVENFVTGKLYTILWKNDTQVTLTCISIGADCVVFQGEAPLNLFTLTMQNAYTIDTIEPTQLGTTNYNNLINKPQVNGVDLIGNKTSADLGIASAEALAGKQDVISDLDTIRSGAAAGATAVQPATLEGYQTLIDSSHKLSSDLVDDTSSTNKFATAAQLAQIGTNENNISSFHKATGTDVFFSETEPEVSTEGNYWISTSGTKISVRTDNDFTYELFNNTNLGASGDGWFVNNNTAVLRIPCEPSTTYTIKIFTTGDIGNVFRLAQCTNDNVPTVIGQPVTVDIITRLESGFNPYTFTTSADAKYILLQMAAGVYSTVIPIIMLVVGSVEPSTYEPYIDWQ